MSEADYQNKLIKKLGLLFPGCVVLKNDSGYLQGVPDLTVLYEDKWALLEVKVNAKARKQPNQQHYVDKFSEMSFAAIIYPENEEDVLDALQRSFETKRPSRRAKR